MSKNILKRFCFVAGISIAVTGGLLAETPEPASPRVRTVVRADPRTGKLVRLVVSTGQSVAGRPAAQTALNATVQRIAAEQSVPPELLHSVIMVESNYNPAAVSPKGAQGLMQLMPETARRFGVPDSFDPVENIQGGAKYLKYLLALYKGDYPRALAAYNAGEKAVAKYGGIPPYAETRNYVAQVQRKIEAAKPVAPPGVAQGSRPAQELLPKPVETSPDAPRHMQQVLALDGSVRYVTQ